MSASGLPDTTVTAVFSGESILDQGKTVGFGGCNNYSADFVVQDDGVIVRPLLGTLAICPVGSERETTYLALLDQAETL